MSATWGMVEKLPGFACSRPVGMTLEQVHTSAHDSDASGISAKVPPSRRQASQTTKNRHRAVRMVAQQGGS